METIEQILYSKISASDFQSINKLNVPATGGGQTYLELARATDSEIDSFMDYAMKRNAQSPQESRLQYTIFAQTLGDTSETFSELYLLTVSARHGRNYRINKQTPDHRHPAWSPANGFPEPARDSNGEYIKDCSEIVKNLRIFIFRTNYKRYYASFLNQPDLPSSWPRGIGLETIFDSDNPKIRGVIDIYDYNIQFKNEKDSPFDLRDWNNAPTPEVFHSGENIIVYGIPGSGKSFQVDQVCKDPKYYERVVFHPDYSYSDFVGQIMPDSQDGSISYPFVPGPFTRILKKAKDRRHNYYLIIEELNRGNAPAIFGDIFQLLDRVKTKTKGKEIGESYYSINNKQIAEEVDGPGATCVKIPHNLIIIATMNTADQNVFTLDTAFKRRWRMFNVMGRMNKCEYRDDKIGDSDIKWADFVHTINKLIIDNGEAGIGAEDKRLGPYFASKEELSNTNKFAQKVLMYLWTDVFKQNHDNLFSKECGSLDDVLRTAKADIKAVFSPDIVFSAAQTDGADEDSSEIDAPIFDDPST